MDIDGSSLPSQNGGEIDQNLLLQFSCMNTTDREELVRQMQKLLGPNMSYNTASFFLDMSNWNLQAAICSYLDYSLPPKLPSMALVKADKNETAVSPGICFEHSWTIMNTGTELWPRDLRVIQVGGEVLGTAALFVEPIPPGHSTTLTSTMVAPRSSGTHRGIFHLVTDKGEKIGDTLLIEITVESETTMALVEQLAALPVPSSRLEENIAPSFSQTPSQDDQMC